MASTLGSTGNSEQAQRFTSSYSSRGYDIIQSKPNFANEFSSITYPFQK